MYKNNYSINSEGVVSQVNPDLQSISDDMYCIYNFDSAPAIDYNNILINAAEEVKNIYTARIFGIDVVNSENNNTPDKQKISSHAPITIQSINNNYIIGSIPRFLQHWRCWHEKN